MSEGKAFASSMTCALEHSHWLADVLRVGGDVLNDIACPVPVGPFGIGPLGWHWPAPSSMTDGHSLMLHAVAGNHLLCLSGPLSVYGRSWKRSLRAQQEPSK